MSVHIPEPWLAAQANDTLRDIIAEKDKLDAEYGRRKGALETRLAGLVDDCMHPVVGVDQEDADDLVCLRCGAYSLDPDSDEHKLLADVEMYPERMILPISSDISQKLSRFCLEDASIFWPRQ